MNECVLALCYCGLEVNVYACVRVCGVCACVCAVLLYFFFVLFRFCDFLQLIEVFFDCSMSF